MTTSHGITCPICKWSSFTEREAVQHTNKKHPKLNEAGDEILCSMCNKAFPNGFKYGKLLTHIRVDHFNYQPFQCSHCDKKYDLQAKLNAHIKTVHSDVWLDGKKKYLCDKCDLTFFTANKLYGHKVRTHETPSHFCQHCGKVFKTSTQKKEHISRNHEKHPSVFCEICGKEFTNPSSFQDHKSK